MKRRVEKPRQPRAKIDEKPMTIESQNTADHHQMIKLQNEYRRQLAKKSGKTASIVIIFAAILLLIWSCQSMAAFGASGDESDDSLSLFEKEIPMSSTNTASETTEKALAERDILPTNVKPTHYNLKIVPDFESFKFKGEAEISLLVQEEGSNSISFNAVELEVTDAVLSFDGHVLKPIARHDDAAMETVKFTFEKSLPKGKTVKLLLTYTGIHNDKMAGFYRSSYTDQAGNKKYLLVTQHEPTDARKSFPCWDEPALKATFDVTLVVPSEMTALSNMDEISTTDAGNGLKAVKFHTTPIMSTYLVAFAVANLDYIETETADAKKTKVRVYTLPGQSHLGQFALDVAAKTLVFFAQYFDMEYPLPKVDLIAIPDFSAGAMENFGLITFRTVYLLFDEKSSAAKAKQTIAYIVGHELAHQWFGNLVTMEWWNDLWLNEGFATWAGWLSTDYLFPEWKVWTGFVEGELQSGLGLDALRSSHPIEVPVKNPSEIHQIFDAISYSKGASVIRMLANFLGSNTFRDGVRAYLKHFKFQNARTVDLWRFLSEESGKNVVEIMNSWTRQIGYPIISVEESSTSGKVFLKATQGRFLSTGNVTAEDDRVIYFAPLQVITSSTPKKPSDIVLSKKTDTFEIKNINPASDEDFIKINFGTTGFYRTKYESSMMKKLGKAVKNGIFGSADRIGLLTDAFATAKAGFSSTVDALDFLEAFHSEEDYIVINEIASEINSIRSVWWEQPAEITSKLKSLQVSFFSPLVQKLGWEYNPAEPTLTALLRTLSISMAGKAGDAAVIAEAKSRFQKFVAGDDSAIHPNVRGTVFAIVLQNGGKEEFDAVIKIYKEATVIDQKLAALGSLGSIANAELLSSLLKMSLNEDFVRPQDIIYVFGPVAANPIGRKLAWAFVKENWQTFYDRYYSAGMSLLSRVVTSTTDSFSSESWANDVSSFFDGKDLPNITRAIQQTLEKIRVNTQWLNRDKEAVEQWLKNKFA